MNAGPRSYASSTVLTLRIAIEAITVTDLLRNNAIQPPGNAAQARLELAAVCRLIAREGMAPIGAARAAARNPDRRGVYFANPGGLLLDEVGASRLVEVDRDGNHLDDGSAEPDSGALALVLDALEAKPDAVAAVQVATNAGCVVASLRDGLLPITQTAFMFHGAIGAHDWDPVAAHNVVWDRIAADLLRCRALLIRGRGLLVAGETLAQTWELLFFLDKCCRSQISAMVAANASGKALTMPSKAVIDHAVKQSRAFVVHSCFVADWPSILEWLDHEESSYRA